MDEQDRQSLAKHLAGMKLGKARAEIRRLDPEATLKYFRNAIGKNEWHTSYELPNIGLKVTLVEEPRKVPMMGTYLVRSKPVYVEARVEPLTRRTITSSSASLPGQLDRTPSDAH